MTISFLITIFEKKIITDVVTALVSTHIHNLSVNALFYFKFLLKSRM